MQGGKKTKDFLIEMSSHESISIMNNAMGDTFFSLVGFLATLDEYILRQSTDEQHIVMVCHDYFNHSSTFSQASLKKNSHTSGQIFNINEINISNNIKSLFI